MFNSSRMTFSKRNYIDCVRGIAVFLMVWGHTIQCGNGQAFIDEKSYYSDLIFRSIYSFHMPLFAIWGGSFVLFPGSLFLPRDNEKTDCFVGISDINLGNH